MAGLARAAYDSGCFENYGVPFCMTVEAEALGSRVDLGSATCEPRVCEYAMRSAGERSALRAMDLSCGRPRVVLDALRILRDEGDPDVPLIGNLVGPVSVAGSLMEPSALYRAMRREPQEAHGLLAFVTDQLVAFGRAQVDAGADVVTIADPSASGEILGPRLFEEYALRYLNVLVDGLHERGARVIVHICGQMRAVWAQLAQLRADALSFDALVPMSRARENLPGRVLMGNVSTYAIENSTPDHVRRAALHCACDGADIVAPACGLGMTSPLANVRAMRAGVLSGARGAGALDGDSGLDAEGHPPCQG